MIYLSGGTDAFRQTLLIELYPKKSRADERQAGRKGNENPKPMRFSAGFSLLARPLYLIPHRKSTRGKKIYVYHVR